MKQSVTSFDDIFQYLILTSNILGLSLYKKDRNGKLHLSKLSLMQTSVYTSFYIFISMTNWDQISLFFWNHSTKSIDLLISFYRISTHVGIFFSILHSFALSKAILILFQRTKLLDSKLINLDRNFIYKSNKAIKRFTFWSILNGIIISTVLFEYAIQFYSNKTLLGITSVVPIYSCSILMLKKINFCTLNMYFEQRFQLINYAFEKKIQQSKQYDKYPTDNVQFCRTIKKIVDMHQELCKIALEINGQYSLQILYCIGTSFIIIVCYGYIIIYLLIFHLNDGIWYIMLGALMKNECQAIVELAVMANMTNNVMKHANLTKTYLAGIKIHTNEEQTKNFVIKLFKIFFF